MKTVRVRKRGKTYSYAFEAGTKPDGKRNTVERGGYATADEAYEEGIKAFTDWKHGGIGITSENTPVSEFMNLWLQKKSKTLAPGSLYTYRVDVKATVGFFKDRCVQDITPAMCDNFLNWLTDKNYARNYIKRIRIIYNSAFKYAVHPCGLLQANPFAYTRLPKNTGGRLTKRTIITPDMFAGLMKQHPFGDPSHIFLNIAYHTGMCIGEILGLTWEHVDLDKGIIEVRQQIPTVSPIGPVLTPKLKTGSRYRDVTLNRALSAVISAWRDEQEMQQLLAGDDYRTYYTESDGRIRVCSPSLVPEDRKPIQLVCTALNGRRLTHYVVTKMLSKHGLNSHSFRHTHATHLLEAGAPVKGIAARLGHKHTSSLTENLYIHTTEQLQQDTLLALESSLADQK